MRLKLEYNEALYCLKAFEDYFGNFDRIDQYMREQKMNSLSELSNNPLFPIEDDLFSNFDIRPKDMDFELCDIAQDRWENLLNITSSHVNVPPVGKNKRVAVKEKYSQKFVGFIRLGSPVINCKPRNELLGQVFTQDPIRSKRFNDSAMMGFVIVPSQPFGYNYLGGKLLAAICCSHEMREMVNKKYGMNLCLFETTSLYGSSKSSSQYDGMKPYLRYRGLTDSDFLPMINGKPFDDLKNFVEKVVGGELVPALTEAGLPTSSRKLKITNTIISLTKAGLKDHKDDYDAFLQIIEKAKTLMEQKRYYSSNYGFKNYIDYINYKTDRLEKDENYDKFHLSNVVEWWKKKAENRFNTLKTEGRLRKELEVWTSGKDIDIIR